MKVTHKVIHYNGTEQWPTYFIWGILLIYTPCINMIWNETLVMTYIENFVVFFVNGNVLFSQHKLNKATIHTWSIVLFKVSFGNNLIFFYNCNAK